MAQAKKPSKGKRGKRTRFGLSSKGELALAAVGVLVIGVVLFLLWMLLSPRILPVDDRVAQKERELKARHEARWSALLRDGAVVKVDQERQDVYVDAARWEALAPPEQQFAAASACAHYRWRRCFVYDGSGAQLGWYIEGDGYHKAPQGK